ncbi:hypothetical protein PRIPAC_96787 [Pristionchus pacificus]|uniref:Uncharacterized protein n=1 Tax=Pristionchus pacificus TaxID=54126 RepID=A0A2A6D167_PRIPA|nr:hypothetical protein PRIPAC_96787 [Pristionchus pacificus]|eukprot:PDM84120.1 hypothetical protein PRIPAC_34312 [Pristionchus pacificus]
MMKRKRGNEESSLNDRNDDSANGDKSTPEIVDIRPLETIIEFEYQIKDLPTSRPEWRLEQDIDSKLIVDFHRKRMEHEQMIIENLQRSMNEREESPSNDVSEDRRCTTIYRRVSRYGKM